MIYSPPINVIMFLFIFPLLGSCTPQEGQFSVTFQWNVEEPLDQELIVQGTVKRVDGGTHPSSPNRIPYNNGTAQLNFGGIPYDIEMIVEVSFYLPNKTNPRYFGRSETFVLKAGQNIIVPVDIGLVDSPDFEESPQAVRVLNASNNLVSTPELNLQVQARGVEAFEIAQDLDFSIGNRIIDTFEQDGDTFRFNYNLNSSRPGCEPDGCEGLRKIFVRVLRSKIAGPSIDLTLILDTTFPRVSLTRVNYVANPRNQLANISAATGVLVNNRFSPGQSTVIINLRFSEEIDEACLRSGLVAVNGDHSFVLEPIAFERPLTTAQFTATIDSSIHPDGQYSLSDLKIKDLAGNQTTVSFNETFVIDSTSNNLIVKQTQVSFIRSPFGNAAEEPLSDSFSISSGIPFFELGPIDGLDGTDRLPEDTFQLQDGSTPRLIRIWAEQERDNLLGTSTPSTMEGNQTYWLRHDLRLVNLDTPQVWVSGLDDAGNESAPVAIETSWFVGSTADRNGRSPHEVSTSAVILSPLGPQIPLAQLDALEGIDSNTYIFNAEHEWKDRTEAHNPDARENHAIAYNSLRSEIVLFGGFDSGLSGPQGPYGDTWIWDGRRWSDMTPRIGSPSARSGHAMVYDKKRDVVVLFGGRPAASTSALSETWIWNDTTWTNLTSHGPQPPPRYNHAMSYDSTRGQTIMHGGRNQSGFLSDTWIWDGESWTEVTSTMNNPDPRSLHSMAYDSSRSMTIMFGGHDNTGRFSDTWQWNGTRWDNITPSSGNPPARRAHVLTYDNHNQQIVMFGGAGRLGGINGQIFSDTWAWDGSSWANITPSNLNPSARFSHAMAYDVAKQAVFMFGGSNGPNSILSSSYSFDGTSWTNITPSSQTPPGSLNYISTYNSAHQRGHLSGHK